MLTDAELDEFVAEIEAEKEEAGMTHNTFSRPPHHMICALLCMFMICALIYVCSVLVRAESSTRPA